MEAAPAPDLQGSRGDGVSEGDTLHAHTPSGGAVEGSHEPQHRPWRRAGLLCGRLSPAGVDEPAVRVTTPWRARDRPSRVLGRLA